MTVQEKEQNSEVMSGGWTPFHPVTPRAMEVFEKAMAGLEGVDYIACEVSSQVVAGTNYRFRCKTYQPYPGGVITGTATVEIYQPLDGEPQITRIYDVQADAVPNLGGWSAFQAPTQQQLNVFNTAMNGFVGVGYTPVKVSTQVVNGTNYRFLCKSILPMAGGNIEGTAIIEIHQPLKGEPMVVSITDADAALVAEHIDSSNQMVGGWSPYREPTAEDMAVFSSVVPTTQGFGYVPVKVSTQVVAGINYRFLAERNILLPAGFPAQPLSMIEIFQSLDGKAQLISITPSNG